MPGSLQAWYSLDDLEMLADRGLVQEGSVELAKLERLSELLHGDRSARMRVSFACRREPDRRLALRLAFAGSVSLQCQRCLEPVEHRLDEALEWIAVETDEAAAGVREPEQPLVLDRGRLRFDELLEDELIVALPLAARHASVDECGPLAQDFRDVLQDSEPPAPNSPARTVV